MKFIFKRKYTGIFLITLILTGLSISFFVLGPNHIQEETLFFIQALIISLADTLLIVTFIFGLDRVNYYLYHDRIEIHRSLRKKIILDHKHIVDISEIANDTVFFMFGKLPSFELKYKKGKKTKTYRIRIANHELFKVVMANEQSIHTPLNK